MWRFNPWGEAVRRLKKELLEERHHAAVARTELVCVCVWGGGGGWGAGERWLSGYYRPKKVENQFSFRAVQCVLLMA